MFETIVKAPRLFSAGGESHMRIEQVADFFPGARGWTSNRLDASDAREPAVERLAEFFYTALRDREGRPASDAVTMVEKTPKNALRVPFFSAAWPDSRFVYLYRDPRETLSSMAEAWATGRFVTYPVLPGWSGPPWSLLLVPGWRQLAGRPLMEIVARQWATTTDILVEDLEALAPSRVVAVDYSELISQPQAVMSRLAGHLGLNWDLELPATLPYSKTTFSRPSPDKWRRFEPQIAALLPLLEKANAKARQFLERHRA